uniref:Predicted protein n=1 Tax=Hordeum vulgare subsp. vulgare TaxID=112509 RepID=F2E141_HORVV|nr:predicted protein [Hordeum vulgare subsp. vulgare]
MNPGGRFVPVLCAESAGGTKDDSPAGVGLVVPGRHLPAGRRRSSPLRHRDGVLPARKIRRRRSSWHPRPTPLGRRAPIEMGSTPLGTPRQHAPPRRGLLHASISWCFTYRPTCADMWQLTRPVQVSSDLELEGSASLVEAARSSSTHVSCPIAGHSIANKSERSSSPVPVS